VRIRLPADVLGSSDPRGPAPGAHPVPALQSETNRASMLGRR